jgi:site-specific DNA-methyltransferase (adenine-specific)
MEDTARVDRMNAEAKERAHAGRWPPNLLLSHADDCLEGGPCSLWCPVRALDAQSGVRPGSHHQKPTHSTNAAFGGGRYDNTSCYADSGGASRFFPTFRYVAKAGRSERNRGCEEIEAQRKSNYAPNDPNENKLQTRLHGSVERRGNHHPTIKPLALMSWLITLITPPGGIVLDPFAGSGSTLCAAKAGGWRYLGIEREAEYVAIAEARLEAIK